VDSSVRHVRLKLSVPEIEREQVPSLRRSIESRFIPDLLAACRERLHREYGEQRLVFVRRLALRCAFEPGELVEPGVATRLGEDLAESLIVKLGRLARAQRLDPPESENTVVLESAAHRDALAVARRITGAPPAWFLEDAEPSVTIWQATSELGGDALSTFVACLEQLGVLEASLRDLSEQSVERVLEQLPLEAWPESARSLLRVRLSRSAAVAEPSERVPQRAPDGNEAPASAWHGEAPPPPPVETGPFASNARVTAGAAAAKPDAGATPKSLPVEAFRIGTSAAHGSQVPSPADVAPRSNVIPVVQAQAELAASEPEILVREAPLDSTEFGGLFYLVRLVLELELAEHLWCVAIPEAPFLTEVARLLLGESGREDCAPLHFGGPGTIPPIDDWAFTEVSSKSRACLERWLHARGVDPAALPSTHDVAAEFERPPALSSRTAALVRDCAATLTIAFCAALDEPPSPPQLLTHLRRAALVELNRDLALVMPMSALETSVRRAGLDFNPGYVPWQRRQITIRFEERA
jgi:hypothetical protein